MTIRRLFPLLFAAVATAVLVPERASAQCWYCDECWLGPKGTTCVLMVPTPPEGITECIQVMECWCFPWKSGNCLPTTAAGRTALEAELGETLAAIRANEPIPADGRVFYVKRGADFVIRRKCDAAEVGRLAIAEVEAPPVVGGG